ncbi:MAG: response regulator [Bradymonadia bacterium]
MKQFENDGAQAEVLAASETPMPTPRQYSVLVVDDDSWSRKTTCDLLSTEGYAIHQAEDGIIGLELFEKVKPDLVLLDVMMPGLDGFEVCRRMKALSGRAHTPVMLLTALDSKREVVQGLKVGADDFLSKPVHGAELRARVANQLKLRAYDQLVRTQRDAARKEVEGLRAQLLHADRLATIGTFAAGVGHELNNISTVLTGVHYALKNDPDFQASIPEELTRSLGRVTEHVTRHASSILRFARPAGVQTEEVDLMHRLGDVTEMLNLTGKTRYVRCTLTGPEQVVLVEAVPIHIEQVFLNLIGNAADALKDDGAGLIEVSVILEEGGPPQVTVSDNGPGMSPDVLARIFEPFFTTKPPGKGTGLGLPVVRQLVEGWGGSIVFESEPGQGTQVRVTFPEVA